MTHIFISHSHADEKIASLLVDFLLAALAIRPEDIRCTSVPGHKLPFGTSIGEQLKNDLNKTTGLIALITKDSLRSTWVLFELGSGWAKEKLVVPILGPGLKYQDLPGPLGNYPGVQIEEENPSYRMTDVINQLAGSLGIQPEINARRDAKLNDFINEFKIWKSSLPEPDISWQKQVEDLKLQLQEIESSHTKQLEDMEVLSQKQKQELEQSYQTQQQELQQQIQQLEQQLEQERSRQTTLESTLKAAQAQLLEKESENAQLLETITRLDKQRPFNTSPPDFNLEMVDIPAGKFNMGSNEDDRGKPIHEVIVPGFQIGKYPVTQAQYQAVMGTNPSRFSGNPQNPVEKVTWFDAQAFCEKLSQLTGKTYRLPTEAEWEYACRAGTRTRFSFGDEENQLGDYAWFNGNSNNTTHPVGEKRPNPWGIYDMHGNVWEWCADQYHESYATKPENIKKNGSIAWLDSNITNQSSMVLRGGSWFNGPVYCRSACRVSFSADGCYDYLGFRVAVSGS